MATLTDLGSAIHSAASAAPPGARSQIKAGMNALEAWLLAEGRKRIDTPEERQAIEAAAVSAFNAFFHLQLGEFGTGLIDGYVSSALEKLLERLAAPATIQPPGQGG